MSEGSIIRTVCQAARAGDVEKMKELIAAGRCVDAADNRGWTPLHEAAEGDHSDCLVILLKHVNTDVNWRDYENATPLLIAARNKSVSSAKLLLDYGADPNLVDFMGNSPLLAAVRSNSLPLAKLLIDKKCNVNVVQYTGTSPLHQAASEGFTDLVDLLLESGARLAIMEDYNLTPIFLAAQHGKKECLQRMLEEAKTRGEQDLVNNLAEDHASPLFLAAQNGHLGCIDLLLVNGASANILTRNPSTLALYAALDFQHFECAEKLFPLTKQELFSKCDENIFSLAMENGSGRSIQFLIDMGMDVNQQYPLGDHVCYMPRALQYTPVRYDNNVTPLTNAALFNSSLANVEILLKNGACVNASRLIELPPLLAALDHKNLQLVLRLLQYNVKVNLYHQGMMGNLAILASLAFCHGLRLLLNHGAEAASVLRPQRSSFSGSQSASGSFNCSHCGCLSKKTSTSAGGSTVDSRTTTSASSSCISKRLFTDSHAGAAANRKQNVCHSCLTDNKTNTIPPLGESEVKPSPLSKVLQRLPLGRAGVTAGQIIYMLLEYVGSVSLDPSLEQFMESKEEWQNIRAITTQPRSLSQLCRVIILQSMQPATLSEPGRVRATLPLPAPVINYLLHQTET